MHILGKLIVFVASELVNNDGKLKSISNKMFVNYVGTKLCKYRYHGYYLRDIFFIQILKKA